MGIDVAAGEVRDGNRRGDSHDDNRSAGGRGHGAVLDGIAFRPAGAGGVGGYAELFAASLLAIVFNQGCFIFGVGLSSPVDASVITTSMPLLAMVFAALYLKEPVSGKKVGGIAAGAAGAVAG